MLRQGCEDDAAWNKLRATLYAEPADVRKARLAAGRAAPTAARVGLTADSVAALLGSAAEQDRIYGSG